MTALSKILSALVLLAVVALAAVRLGLVTEAHSPFAPLSLDAPDQWFVDFKLAALRDDPRLCRVLLTQQPYVDAVPVPDRPPRGGCGWQNGFAFSKVGGASLSVRPLSCEMTAATTLWVLREVQPAARATLGSGVAKIHHFGSYSCRNIAGRDRRSQHAKANAIDISSFTLEDGRNISVLKDWTGTGAEAAFLDRIYDGACRYFRVTLGPDYNTSHADHFHFDRSGFWYCP
jgi:hypothetical protein